MSYAYWQETQRILQGSAPLVRRPKLTDALLQKSPFRFLHDVVSEVQRNTGFASDLYSGSELDARAIQDRTGKVAYLQKIFDAVSVTLQEPVPADPSQVVAGQEPEKTNKFLQMLGQAALKGSVPQATALSVNISAQASHPKSRPQIISDASSISDTPKFAGHGPPKRRSRNSAQVASHQARRSTKQQAPAGTVDRAQGMEQLCSAIAQVTEFAGQLSRHLDGVDEDAEARRAQIRFWQGEAMAYEAQLQDVKLMHKRRMTTMSAQSAKLDAQIEAALQRLRALDFEKQCNAEKISLLGGDHLQDKGSLRPL